MNPNTRRRLRRYGPALFWQSAWFTIVMLPLAALAFWLAADGTFLMWAWAVGLIVAATIGAFKMVPTISRAIFIASPAGPTEGEIPEPPQHSRFAVSGDLRVPMAKVVGYGFIAMIAALNIARDSGFAWGMKTFLLYWALVFTGVWIWWAVEGRRPSPESLPRPVLPGSDLIDARLISQVRTEDSETLAVSVTVRRPASTEKVVYSVLLLQLLPQISGGERQWRVSIDGELVGIAVQTWEHPRWWPQIVWTSDRDASYSGQEVSFSLARPPASENPVE